METYPTLDLCNSSPSLGDKLQIYRRTVILTLTLGLVVLGWWSTAERAVAVPSAGSEYAMNVSSNSAEVSAVVNPGGEDARYFFEYGSDTTYADGKLPTASGIDIGDAESDEVVRVVLRGLRSGVKYHYRVVVYPVAGTLSQAIYGEDHVLYTFSTRDPGLPDARKWEMVSPLAKNSSDILGIDGDSEGGVVESSPDGEKITYLSRGSFGDESAGAPIGSQYIATRGDGPIWATQNITVPSLSNSYSYVGFGAPYKAFSTDLEHALIPNGGAYLPIENEPLAPNAPPGYKNYYIRNDLNGNFEALLTRRPSVSAATFEMEMRGATPDLKHFVVRSSSPLSAGSSTDLYEWSAGEFVPLGVLPDGTESTEADLGSGRGESNSISEDGSHVFWSISEEPVFARVGSTTIEVPGGRLLMASTSGSRTVMRSGLVYDVAERRVIANLDLLVHGEEGFKGILGASNDLSTIYFVDTGAVSEGGAHAPIAGEDNLYSWQTDGTGEGVVKFIGTLSADDNSGTSETVNEPGDAHDWAPSLGERTARVTADGQHLVFMSDASLTGYDNVDVITGALDEEVFEYDTHAGVVCVSCNPTRERPVGPSDIPAGTDYAGAGLVAGLRPALYASRVLSDDGSRVFFDSSDSLVPRDTNGRVSGGEASGTGRDVYEYEDGEAALLSGGQDSDESTFVDASISGQDVFFVTRAPLVNSDTDVLTDLYDARAPHTEDEVVGTASVTPIAGCSDEACRPVAAGGGLETGTPASGLLGASGNLPLTPAVMKSVVKKAKAKKKPKTAKVKRKARPRHQARKSLARQRRRAGHSRASRAVHNREGR